jgi:hypothetical protein
LHELEPGGIDTSDQDEATAWSEDLSWPLRGHYPLVVHVPTLGPQQGRDPTIPIAAIPARETDNRRRQSILVRRGDRLVALGRPLFPAQLCQLLGDGFDSGTDLILRMQA